MLKANGFSLKVHMGPASGGGGTIARQAPPVELPPDPLFEPSLTLRQQPASDSTTSADFHQGTLTEMSYHSRW
jgi:hypothetical protein